MYQTSEELMAPAKRRYYGGWNALDEEAPMRPLAPGSGHHDKR